LIEEGLARQFNSRIQKTRKEIGVHIDDKVEIFVDLSGCTSVLKSAIEKNWEQISAKMKSPMN